MQIVLKGRFEKFSLSILDILIFRVLCESFQK